jgi:predicted amidohydrolase YtcJ
MEPRLTLYYNATIITSDTAQPRAAGMLTKDGVIVAVGNVEDLSPGAAVRIDLDGASMVPGFNDCHMHILSMGLGLQQIDLKPEAAPSLRDITNAVRRRASTSPAGAWLLGRGYNQNVLPERRHPNRLDLDPVAGGRPVVLWHTSGHVVTANSTALEAAGIGPGTPDVEGGEIERDAQGRPTGVLKECAIGLIRRAIPPITPAFGRDAILAASRVLASEGITSASDAATGQALPAREEAALYRAAHDSGSLQTRVTLMPLIEHVTDAGLTPADIGHPEPSWVSVGHAKIFTDGALTTHTAALLSPYDDTTTYGLLTWDHADLLQHCRRALALGWPLAAHAIGDRAIQQVLDTFTALDLDPMSRPRIEHATICADGQIQRMREMCVTVVLQPEDIAVLGDAYPPALGPRRADNNSPVGDFEREGVAVAFSSDRPVTPGHPLVGIRAAVERRCASGILLGAKSHAVSAETAIRYYTAGAAYATQDESWKGALRAGQAADFVVLDRDVTVCPVGDISAARVLRTVVAGETVFEA